MGFATDGETRTWMTGWLAGCTVDSADSGDRGRREDRAAAPLLANHSVTHQLQLLGWIREGVCVSILCSFFLRKTTASQGPMLLGSWGC